MLSKIKAKNEEILQNHFQELFGDAYQIEVSWGFPFVVVNIVLDNKEVKTITQVSIDMMQEAGFQLRILGAKKVYEPVQEGDEPIITLVPDWTSIDSNTINVISERIKLITEQFFTTREVPAPPAPKEEEASEESDGGDWDEEESKEEPEEKVEKNVEESADEEVIEDILLAEKPVKEIVEEEVE